MVTGSVGKTSTKDAVAAALSVKYNLRKSEKSYNSDFGMPFTIIGVGNPWANPAAWIKVFAHALSLIIYTRNYPKLLVLEVGADAPGDLAKILKITKPDVVVVTLLPDVPVHVEAYSTPYAVREEEFSPALALPEDAPLIISADDKFALSRSSKINKDVCTYGMSADANVRILDISIWQGKTEYEVFGMLATIEVNKLKYALQVKGAIGRSQLYAPTAAVAAALTQKMTVDEAMKGLESYLPPPGRGRIFTGKKNTLLIDDTYNSSPAAVEEILKSLVLIPGKRRKIVVLGDMLELGRYSVAEHAHVGHLAKEVSDVLVTVGYRAKGISDAALADGMQEGSVMHFETSIEAALHVEEMLEEGDVVLVKGSQGIRMERIVRPLLADFTDTKDLVRQDAEWLKR
jgi:UDP-N-acetylmuramoyl-tripeptide--D-alanyl-D-alanine ligase